MNEEVKPLIIALGGAGIEMVSKYAQKQLYTHCIFIDTDPATLLYNRGVPKIHLEIEQFNGVVKTLPELMLQQKKTLWKVVNAYSKVILVTGLGGYTGTQLAKVIWGWLKEEEKLCFLLATTPMLTESIMHYKTGEKAALQLKNDLPPANLFILNTQALTETLTDAKPWQYYEIAYGYIQEQIDFIVNEGRLNL